MIGQRRAGTSRGAGTRWGCGAAGRRARPARVIVLTDTLPVRRERSAVKKALKLAQHERAKDAFEYRILHHASRADLDLQVADSVS